MLQNVENLKTTSMHSSPHSQKKPQRQKEEKEKNLPITSKHTFWSSAAAAAAAASYCFG